MDLLQQSLSGFERVTSLIIKPSAPDFAKLPLRVGRSRKCRGAILVQRLQLSRDGRQLRYPCREMSVKRGLRFLAKITATNGTILRMDVG